MNIVINFIPSRKGKPHGAGGYSLYNKTITLKSLRTHYLKM